MEVTQLSKKERKALAKAQKAAQQAEVSPAEQVAPEVVVVEQHDPTDFYGDWDPKAFLATIPPAPAARVVVRGVWEGHSICAVIRAFPGLGYTAKQASKFTQQVSPGTSPSTIQCQYYGAKKGKRGTPAVLTEAQKEALATLVN